jgi:hypothetical protein
LSDGFASLIAPLARHFFGEPNARMSNMAELRFGKHGSLSIHLKKGTWYDHEAQTGGGAIDLVKLQKGFAETAEVMRWLEAEGWRDKQTSRPERDPERDNLPLADRIWRASVPIAGTPDAAYLAARGIALDPVPEGGGLHFHPRCPWQSDTAPCIVARFTDTITREPLGIHRRRIDSRGKPMALGPTRGGVIRLSHDEDVTTALVIGEGVETVLAAMTKITHRFTLLRPAWACGSAGMLENFPVLAGIEALTILVDADRNGRGQNAAKQCAERWADAGREVTRLTPRDLGTDFNDLIRGTR